MMSTKLTPLTRCSAPAVLFLLSGALVAAPALAQDAGEKVELSESERTRSRLLYLKNGSVLRGFCHTIGTDWEIKLGKEWQTIPVTFVERTADERALLAEAKRRASRIKRDDHDARVEHARWLSAEGLSIECLTALDRVLRAEPDQPAALEFIQERPIRLALPAPEAGLVLFFTAASRLGPGAREIGLDKLKLVEDREALRTGLSAELVQERDERREFALLALRRLFPGEEINGILRRAVLDRDDEVRHFAALALRDAKNPDVAVPVIRALGSAHYIVRRHAAEALGVMNYAAAVQPLITTLASSGGHRAPASNIYVGTQTAYVQDFDVEVATGESIARPRVNVLVEGAVLDVRVLSSSSTQVSTERRAIRSALTNLTGAKVASTQKAWEKWLDKHGEAWLAERENAEH